MGLYDQWYENAIFYCLDVETYADSNGDGVGDFRGLTSRLEYIAGLGVTCLWLMPFFPTPGGDDGYDVADYESIDPRLGTLSDFSEFIYEAHERGLRVIIDLVPNHTSIEHPWFQAARADPDSPYRDYYVWRADDPGDTSDQVVFPGEQEGIWTYDEAAGAYYLHHFYEFQPDLNFANPRVRAEFRRLVGFWLQQGVSGFRVDAAPFLINLLGVENTLGMQQAHEYLRELWEVTAKRSQAAILLGEVDVDLSVMADYFGGGNELQALFNFPLNRALFLALAEGSADPVRLALNELPSIPGAGQWVNFLRHHDELNLLRLTSRQREQVYAAFGPEAELQVYDRGLRRRLAPMLGGDQGWLRLAYSLLFSLPGTPMLFYGEELGMGENLSLPGRLSVRAPMQWSTYDNGGFSSAPVEQHVRPVLAGGDYGFEQVAVSRQRGDRDSLLNWLAMLIRVRRECPEIGTGQWSVIDAGDDAVLGLRHDGAEASTVILNNLASTHRTVTLELPADEAERATDLLGDRDYTPLADDQRMRLNGHGYRWLRLGGIY